MDKDTEPAGGLAIAADSTVGQRLSSLEANMGSVSG